MIDRDGICLVGERVESGTIIVNKESPISVADLNVGTGGPPSPSFDLCPYKQLIGVLKH